ncbi:MAG: hypothetical protein HY914_20500 [Desulfomonile tiedjei]|nr:hypothetical protein [Desulfomonile tiedjei]
MTADRTSTHLFTAALLSVREDLSHHSRSLVISRTHPFDIHSRDETISGLAEAFGESDLDFSPTRHARPQTLYKAGEISTHWLAQGVSVLTLEDLHAPQVSMHPVPPVVFAHGNRSILNLPAAMVLNSRTRRLVTAQDPWILATRQMVEFAFQQGFALASSYGTIPYSVATRLAKNRPVLIACDDVLPFMKGKEEEERFLHRYGDLFDIKNTLFLSTFPPGRVPAAKYRRTERDHLVAATSSLLLPAGVRPGGNMASILEIGQRRGVHIACASAKDQENNSATACPPEQNNSRRRKRPEQKPATRQGTPVEDRDASSRGSASSWPLAHEGTQRENSQALLQPPSPEILREADTLARTRRYLVHYTRSCPGPWPGQTLADYCDGLIEDRLLANHTAFDTLGRILERGVIHGAGRFTRGGLPVVCLTELFPEELREVTRWRPGLLRWSFEPYGIALPKSCLFAMGARPVIYGVEKAFEDLGPDLIHLFQVQRTGGANWAVEKEWRIAGDLRLAGPVLDEMFVLVPSRAEARVVADRFGCRVVVA